MLVTLVYVHPPYLSRASLLPFFPSTWSLVSGRLRDGLLCAAKDPTHIPGSADPPPSRPRPSRFSRGGQAAKIWIGRPPPLIGQTHPAKGIRGPRTRHPISVYHLHLTLAQLGPRTRVRACCYVRTATPGSCRTAGWHTYIRAFAPTRLLDGTLSKHSIPEGGRLLDLADRQSPPLVRPCHRATCPHGDVRLGAALASCLPTYIENKGRCVSGISGGACLVKEVVTGSFCMQQRLGNRHPIIDHLIGGWGRLLIIAQCQR